MASNPNNEFREVLHNDGGMKNTYRSPAGGEQEVYKTKDGRRGFSHNNGEIYYEDPDEPGKFVSTTNARDYVMLGAIEQASSGGGGGGGESPQREFISGVTGDVGAVSTPGVTTEQVLGSQNYNNMNNFAPTAHTMGNDGQTQHLNPLVAAQNWMHQLQPQPTYNQGLYINPGVGLLEDEQQNSIWGIV